MCIAAWIWQSHPPYQLLLFLNRDEFHDRPTEPVGWWGESNKKILGGRDEKGGGTWLGCTKEGRVAFITNFREPDSLSGAKTRGALPLRFLKFYDSLSLLVWNSLYKSSDNHSYSLSGKHQSTKSPQECAEEIVEEADQYNGFNLILADLCSRTMIYISNRPKGQSLSVQTVSPGLHVLSNANLDTPWPKVQRLHDNLKELLEKHGNQEVIAEQVIGQLMGDKSKADRDNLPNTGLPSEWELELSPIFVETDTEVGRYGTRSMAALSAKGNGEVTFFERYLENGMWKEHTMRYQIENTSAI